MRLKKSQPFSNQQVLKPFFIMFPCNSLPAAVASGSSGVWSFCALVHYLCGRIKCPEFIVPGGERTENRNGVLRVLAAIPWSAFLLCPVKFLSICWLTGSLTVCMLRVSGHGSSSAPVLWRWARFRTSAPLAGCQSLTPSKGLKKEAPGIQSLLKNPSFLLLEFSTWFWAFSKLLFYFQNHDQWKVGNC